MNVLCPWRSCGCPSLGGQRNERRGDHLAAEPVSEPRGLLEFLPRDRPDAGPQVGLEARGDVGGVMEESLAALHERAGEGDGHHDARPHDEPARHARASRIARGQEIPRERRHGDLGGEREPHDAIARVPRRRSRAGHRDGERARPAPEPPGSRPRQREQQRHDEHELGRIGTRPAVHFMARDLDREHVLQHLAHQGERGPRGERDPPRSPRRVPARGADEVDAERERAIEQFRAQFAQRVRAVDAPCDRRHPEQRPSAPGNGDVARKRDALPPDLAPAHGERAAAREQRGRAQPRAAREREEEEEREGSRDQHTVGHHGGGSLRQLAGRLGFGHGMVNWRARHDSNVRPLPSEGSTLIQLSYGRVSSGF